MAKDFRLIKRGIDKTEEESAAGADVVAPQYEVGHPKRYGAVGDGTTDDTVPVQAAIDVASASNLPVQLGGGIYLVQTLTLDSSNLLITGPGTLRAATSIPASGAILLSLAGGSDAAVNQALLDGIYGSSVQSVRTSVTGSLVNVVIYKVTFDQGSNTNAIRGIWMTGFTRGCRIESCYSDDLKGDGIVLNGSWTFSLIGNHVKGDDTNGTGISLGRTGNGERGGSSVVNAPCIFANEVTGHANAVIWNFGVGGAVFGNTWEGNVTDGFASQSVEGILYSGNYHENNGGDNLQMGGTNGTDFAEDWVVSGNYFNATSGEHIRLNGCQRCRIGPNNFGGSVTRQYFIAIGIGQYITGCDIVVPEYSSTYIGNFAAEADGRYNKWHDGTNNKFIATENASKTFDINDFARILYKASGGAGETWTIDSEANLPVPVGAELEGFNNGGGDLTLAITSDTLVGSTTVTDGTGFKLRKILSTTWARLR